MNTMSHHNRIPTGAGSSRLVRENITVHGRRVRVARVVFTTHDGFVGESRLRHGEFGAALHAAYEAAVAERARALFRAREEAANVLPSAAPQAPKPAPAVQLLHCIKDTFLCSELERRGYEISLA